MPVVNLIKNLQHCKNLQRIIFAGSIEEYGKARYPYKENSIPRPISSYGRYKYKSYKYVKKKLINNRIEYVWLRPSLMFGPKDNSQRFLGTILSGLKNKEVFKISLGKQMRDFLFVEDFNKFIHLHLIKKKFVKLKLVNLSNENWLSLKFIINKINLLSKVDIEKYLHIKKIADDSKLINSGLLLKKNYPRFKFTNFFYALKKTIKSYRI
jgi:nucleoside-diphosphate-sugar epimerase